MTVAHQTSGLKSLKLEVVKVTHGSFGGGLLWRIVMSIEAGKIVDVGIFDRGGTRLSRLLSVPSSLLGLSKVST